ncbi:MAG: LCP family protein [Nocardioides sp.]|uniref:LCP family protein n=1 Tax=Nocardioides sp. TaxID=35761 RepID=UPI003F04793F
MPDDSRRATAPKRRGKPKHHHTVLRVITSTLVVLAMVTGLSVVYLYRHLNSNIDTRDITAALGKDRPEKTYTGNGEPLNVLVLGSDTRDGEGNKIDGEAGGGVSDTTILLHVSGDRTRAYGISIPRDTILDRPACGENDEIPGGTNAMWNDAFAYGGAACTIRQFEANTDIRVDHFIEVDFNGFKGMVDAIDGVPVCLPEPIDDPEHQIHLEAGERELRGDEALSYVRVRYKIGDGSDIGRTKRQQEFIASMVNKVVSAGTLTRLDRVIGFLDAATKSLTTDEGLGSTAKMGRLAMQLQNIGMDKIQFITIPNAYFDRDSGYWGRVYWTEEADQVWERIRLDKPLTKALTTGSISAAKAPGAKKTQDPEPSDDPSTTTTPGTGGDGGTGGTAGPTPDEEAAAEARLAVGLCA